MTGLRQGGSVMMSRGPQASEIAAWADRWRSDGRELAAAARGWLAGRRSRPDGLAEVGGRIDLRGLPLTGAPLTLGDDQDPDAGIRWESLDLSGARCDALHLFGPRVVDCVFDDASMVELRVWGGSIDDCSFQRSDLRHSVLGAGEWHGARTRWAGVAFDRAKLTRSVFTGAVLDRCSFNRPGRLLQLQDCSVVGCSFRGILDSLVIDGRGHRVPTATTMTGFSADLSRAVFRNTMITGYRLDHLALPQQDDLLVAERSSDLVAAATWLDVNEPTEHGARAAALLRTVTSAPGPDDDAGLVCDLAALGDPTMVELIRRAWSGSRPS